MAWPKNQNIRVWDALWPSVAYCGLFLLPIIYLDIEAIEKICLKNISRAKTSGLRYLSQCTEKTLICVDLYCWEWQVRLKRLLKPLSYRSFSFLSFLILSFLVFPSISLVFKTFQDLAHAKFLPDVHFWAASRTLGTSSFKINNG